jgi:hypothetical protein
MADPCRAICRRLEPQLLLSAQITHPEGKLNDRHRENWQDFSARFSGMRRLTAEIPDGPHKSFWLRGAGSWNLQPTRRAVI